MPLIERRALLAREFNTRIPGQFELAESLICDQLPPSTASTHDTQADESAPSSTSASDNNASASDLGERIEAFLQQSIAIGCEGLIVKSLASDEDGEYQPNKRGPSWLKLKKDYIASMGDSLDLIPIGAWHGNGRKAKWFSPYLLACVDPETDELQSVCRCMSGFTDAFYEESSRFYRGLDPLCDAEDETSDSNVSEAAKNHEDDREHESATPSLRIISGPKPYYRTRETPDVWFEPSEIFEIRGADFTLSSVHQAGIGLIAGNESKGVSLRFPRFLRKRTDKTRLFEDATTSEQIVDMYYKQTAQLPRGNLSPK